MRRTIPFLIAAIFCMFLYAMPAKAAESHTVARTTATPTSTRTFLPKCRTEDGAGQALCMWDAKRQGNGKGRSIISGDCAPSVVGWRNVSACTMLHRKSATTKIYSDGSKVYTPKGSILIDECISDNRKNYKAIGSCIRAWLKG